MEIEYSKLMALIAARQESSPEAAPVLAALIMDINQAVGEAAPAGGSAEALMELWNEMAGKILPPCRKLTEKRRRAAKARLREFPDREDWTRFIRHILSSAWHTGNNSSGWKANFDWLVKPESIVKFLEGRYNTAPKNPAEGYRGELDGRE
jgi:hypothetical protein